MTKELLIVGRRFLVLLQKTEDQIRRTEISRDPSNLVLQIVNWKLVVALILQKISSSLDGATDLNFEIKSLIFSSKYAKETENEKS